MIVAAAIAPLLALIGGGIDMGRSYVSETRLQQACDAGVLAARKALGSQVVTTGVVPYSVSIIGNRFFNVNFPSGAYGSTDRAFTMTLEADYSISGNASANVPTTIMRVFGQESVPIAVNCEAKLNFSNTDVMMVLDTTGSMNGTNPGDREP
ncbi:MAG: Tad domain-containing protein, partial [Novosphingobium sp.]